MLELGALAFASPWLLVALAGIPALWWLLRVMPPRPAIQAFPPLRFLLALRPQEETPAHTPLWLILLRALIAALIILALAKPLWNPGETLHGNGPLVLVIDNGWASAPRWEQRIESGTVLINQAEREGRSVLILPTARIRQDGTITSSGVLRPERARQVLRALKPRPWPADRRATLAAVAKLKLNGSAHVAWLSDGHSDNDTQDLMQRLQEMGALHLYRDQFDQLARLVTAPKGNVDGLTTTILRADAKGDSAVTLRLDDDQGRLLGRTTATFKDSEKAVQAKFAVPSEIRNKAARISIEGESGAGALFLMDDRWRRRPVGIVSSSRGTAAQPLLSNDYYIARALDPFSDVARGTIEDLLKRDRAMIVLADIGKISGTETNQLEDWVKDGGVLLRFAGPHLEKGSNALVPVRIRSTGRALGGAMSWSQPAKMMPFDRASPFKGLKIPSDVRIKRQVLAEPTLDLNEKTWARLSDGTPLVTAERRGDGWIVLMHITANTDWSNLPLSGLFIEMLERIAGLSRGVASEDGNLTYAALQTMNGFGVLQLPDAEISPIRSSDFAETRPSPRSPPGYYGRGDFRRALNISTGISELSVIDTVPGGVSISPYSLVAGTAIKPWLLLAALALLMFDLFISFFLRGLGPRTKSLASTTALLACLMLTAAMGSPASAQGPTSPQDDEKVLSEALKNAKDEKERFALNATLKTRLAFVITGDSRIDGISRAGLRGLSQVLARRTAIEPGAPMAVDIERDELAFFPVLYWPVSQGQRPPSDRAVAKLNTYLRTGGTILLDTREQGALDPDLLGTGGARMAKLRQLIGDLDIPPLIPVPADHVLTKAFYLLNQFPGRWAGGTVWVERRGGRHNDGVSSVIIGSHDWAAAWARDANGIPMFPLVPNGERQREYAFRFGVNWIMYAMTGNYKTDQVHVPSIIERLGQ